MHRKIALGFFLSGLLLALSTSLAQTRPASRPADADLTPQQIDTLIANLGDANPALRDQADERLRRAGWAAINALAIASAQTKSEELRARARSIITSTCINENDLTPGEPAKLQEYLASDGSRREMLGMDLARSDAAIPAVEATLLTTGDYQTDLLLDATRRPRPTNMPAPPSSPAARWKRDWSLAVGALGSYSEFGNHSVPDLLYAARRDEHAYPIARALMALLQNIPADEKHQWTRGEIENLIILLLWTSGHIEEASALPAHAGAAIANVPELLAITREDWKALGANTDGADLFDRAAAFQFSGQPEKADDLLKYNGRPFEENAVNFSGRHPMLLGHMDLSIRLFEDNQDQLDAGIFLLLQRRYGDAESLIRRANASGYAQAAALQSQMIPALVHLNDLSQAHTLAQKLLATKDPMNVEWVYEALEEAQFRLGADLGIASPKPIDRRNLFYPNDRQADAWAIILGDGNDPSPETLTRIGRILAGHPTDGDDAAVINYASKAPPSLRLGEADFEKVVPQFYANFYEAYLLQKGGHPDLASRWLALSLAPILPDYRPESITLNSSTQYDPVLPLVEILSLRDWKFAQPMLQKLGAPDTADPVLSFLLGVCTRNLGNKEAGGRLMDSADQRLAGDIPRRLYLTSILSAAGEAALAEQQAQLILRLSEPLGPGFSEAEEFLAQAAIEKQDYPEALLHLRPAIISRFHWWVLPEDPATYIRIPRQLALCDAMVAIQNNNRGAALAAAKTLSAIDPEDLGWTIRLGLRMKSAGWNEEARALVDANRAALEDILKDFPNSHLHHYLIARLDTETGFINAQTAGHLARAIALAPGNPDYLSLQRQLPQTAPAR